MCGAMMEVSADDDGRHSNCPVCRRRFAVRFSEDVSTGQKGVSLQYLTDNRKSGETSTIGGGTTSFQMPGTVLQRRPRHPHGGESGRSALPLSRKAMLSIPSRDREAVECPSDGARMLIFMIRPGGEFSRSTFSRSTTSRAAHARHQQESERPFLRMIPIPAVASWSIRADR